MNSANRRVERDQNDKPSAGQHEDERRPLTAGSLVDCDGDVRQSWTSHHFREPNSVCLLTLAVPTSTAPHGGTARQAA